MSMNSPHRQTRTPQGRGHAGQGADYGDDGGGRCKGADGAVEGIEQVRRTLRTSAAPRNSRSLPPAKRCCHAQLRAKSRTRAVRHSPGPSRFRSATTPKSPTADHGRDASVTTSSFPRATGRYSNSIVM